KNQQPAPVEPGPYADNLPAISPAGRVHLSIGDFARYAAWHARGGLKGPTLLTDASFTKLHTPAAGWTYAMGWSTCERSWAGGQALMHNGSNTMWYALMWIAPAKDAAFVAATNIAGDDAAKGCDAAISALVRKLLPGS